MIVERVRIGEDDGRRVLLVDNVVQSIADWGDARAVEAGYWRAMIPDTRPERLLLLGLGTGTIAHLIQSRFGSVPMIAVDDDPEVISLAREHLRQIDGLTIVLDDAFQYAQTAEERFDLICVDLFRGGEPQGGVVRKPFLRSLRRLLLPRGHAVFNLFCDRRTDLRIQRINRVLRVERTIRVEKNVVVWAR